MKKNIIFILISSSVVILIIFLFILFSLPQSKTTNQKQEIVLPTQVQITPVRLKIIPPSTKKIPTTGPSHVNLSAPSTQDSIQEVNKLSGFLPHTESFISSVGVAVEIFIPGKNLQQRTWALQIQTLGINFQENPQSPRYTIMKQSFREAAQLVFSFLESHGVKSDKLFITWGDRTYEQETAEKWLQN